MSKVFTPEIIAYANFFYGKDRNKPNSKLSKSYGYEVKTKSLITAFDYAWNSHQKGNKHHWQYWILRMDDGSEKILEMPRKYVIEMVCDWIGAGKARGATDPQEVSKWYEKNKHNIKLHKKTRKLVESIIS